MYGYGFWQVQVQVGKNLPAGDPCPSLGPSKAPAASVLSIAPLSWVGSICVKINCKNFRSTEELTKQKINLFGLGKLERQTDGYYNVTTLPI